MNSRAVTTLVVLSDLHLAPAGSQSTLRALTELLRSNPHREIVLNGDVFGLSSDPPDQDPVRSVHDALASSADTLAALRAHLSTGAPITLIAGNHDAALGSEGVRRALLALIGLGDAAPLQVEPWFIRRGVVHVEHGHLWDPDNAPVHPLGGTSFATEPLGIQLTRRFVARHNVWEFAHAHETTLAAGLRRAFDLFGVRAPLLVARYFAASSRIVAETLFDRGIDGERARGASVLAEQASRAALAPELLEELIRRAPVPTHVRFRTTFFRLYYDRVLSALGLCAGALAMGFRGSPLGAAVAVGSGAYLHWNVKQSGSRYQNQPIRRLRDGAAVVRQVTGAELVVFGHTHVPELTDGYANAGSFGYPATGMGAPYLVIDAESGRAELRRQN